MTLEEISQIDLNNVDYYTLKDGTIIKIKREGEEQYMNQNNQYSGEEYQGQNQCEQSNTIQNNYEINQQNLTNQNQDNEQILQPGENCGFYISNESGKYSHSQENLSLNDYQSQDFLNYNAQLIDADAYNNLELNQLQFKNLALAGPQYFRFGPKRQLYKLVEAIPVKTNINNSSQDKVNSYMVNNSNYQNVNMASEEQLNQNNYVNLNLGRNFSFNQENTGVQSAC